MQARVNYVIVNDLPKSRTPSSTQLIIIPDHNVDILIEFHGHILFINIKDVNECDIGKYEWIYLTLRGGWQPYIENYNVYSMTSAEVEWSQRLYDTVINN